MLSGNHIAATIGQQALLGFITSALRNNASPINKNHSRRFLHSDSKIIGETFTYIHLVRPIDVTCPVRLAKSIVRLLQL